MNRFKTGAMLLALMAILAACGKQSAPATEGTSAPTAKAEAPAATTPTSISFVDTQEGKPMTIDPKLFDTPAAKEFLATGKNPYIGNEEQIKKGKRIFGLYSCTQCHGPEARGQVGPGLIGPTFRYPKNATNKGMFETIWHGTNGGMGAKGLGLMNPGTPEDGIKPDEILQVISWIRSQGTLTGNE